MSQSNGRILIVAGEASSSLYAQRLIEHWQSQGQNHRAFGIGSRAMEKLGFQCLGRSEEMAVVGLQEVIRHFPLIRRVYNSLLTECDREKPDVALLLDYPDFNLRLAKDLKKRGIPVVYYISPQVWAWRRSRVRLIKRVVDRMLVLLPFEETFYRERGVQASFVGHPLLDEIAQRQDSPETRRRQRERYGIAPDEIVLALMPGSRESELRHHLRDQIAAAELLAQRYPKLRVMLLCAPTIERERLSPAVAEATVPITILRDAPLDMIALGDIVLVASGTATLMVGLMEKPMVIMYRMNALTAWIARRLVTYTRYFGLVNLVLGRLVATELFQELASPAGMATELEKLLDPAVHAEQARALSELKSKLGQRGATVRVAESLHPYFGAKR